MNTEENLTLKQALKLLRTYSCAEPRLVESDTEKTALQSALSLVSDHCDYQNFGVCADSIEDAFVALEAYLQGLNYEIVVDKSEIPTITGPVYVKFNTKKWSVYADSYVGKYRGVLISCQSATIEEINGTYGHFPLDLFIY